MTGPASAGPWPEGADAALNIWRQGHLLDGVPLFGLAAASPATPIWAAGKPTGAAIDSLPLLAEEPAARRRVMVISQGCDLVKPSFPFATVVPVYDATDVLTPSQQETALAGLTWHLVALTASWASPALWVADLRIEMGIDKTLLAEAGPIEAFSDETGYAKLAERLAAVRLRPAVPEPCLDHVVTPLREHLAGRRAEGAHPLAGVREVRVQSNDPVEPSVVTLFVIGETVPPDPAEWDTAFDQVYPHAAEHGITLVGPELTTIFEMSAADYITSHMIDDADSS